ncbi:beta-defensin 113 [Acomys russatus]|uniref:beta-defensin 113 n=1 Tax=Acomys russatus TaxID=60746 RepID=UPI0021E2DB55|nr:beta-defensin 113 [Acomys russatus]
MQSAMKMLCIFLIVVFTVSCGPAAPQMKTREVAERTHKCYLVRGACKSECTSWEYVYNYCDTEPCCVIREYQKPIMGLSSVPTYPVTV